MKSRRIPRNPPAFLEIAIAVLQERRFSVVLRQYGAFYWICDVDLRIIVCNSPSVSLVKICVNPHDDVCTVLKGQESMSKSLRDVHLLSIGGRQLYAHPPHVVRRILSQVYRKVQPASFGAPKQLCLGHRVVLKMNAVKCSCLLGAVHIFLDKIFIYSCFGQFSF